MGRRNFIAVGWFPRNDPHRAETMLQGWLRQRVQAGGFIPSNAWQRWARRAANREVEQWLWRVQQMGGSITTHGYVACERTVNHYGPRTETLESWQAIRKGPETETELRQWGYRIDSSASVHTGYYQQYNATLRARLLHGMMPNEAHYHAVRDMDALGRNLVFNAVVQMVLATAGASAPGAPHSAPGSGVVQVYPIAESFRD